MAEVLLGLVGVWRFLLFVFGLLVFGNYYLGGFGGLWAALLF